MGRLVVGGVFERHLRAVRRVVHQCVDTTRGYRRRGVDAERSVVRLAPDDLLAPIAQQIGGQGRGGLGPVVGRALAAAQERPAAGLGD